MRRAALVLSPRPVAAGSGGGVAWGASDGWEAHGPEAKETRLRLLALQGYWLELEGNILAEQRKEGRDEERIDIKTATGNITPGQSFSSALASLEEAAKLGDEVVSCSTANGAKPFAAEGAMFASPRPPASYGLDGVSSANTGRYSAREARLTPGVVDAAGEAMLKLAKLCETLATGDSVLDDGGRCRDDLAALAVKRYLSAMSVG